jgi:hypothetical protein
MTYSSRLRMIFALLFALLLATLAVQPRAKAADEKWRARYYNNRDAGGDAVLRRDEKAIDYDWGDGSPSDSVNDDDFSARWTRTIYLSGGVYRFSATMDDGMRVWIDDALVIDEWKDSQVRTVSVDLYMSTGDHELEVRYYEAGGKAVAKFNWAAVQGPPPVAANRWNGAYFNNQTLSGAPTFERADNAIDFNWKTGSPWPTIPADHFSVRWTGAFEHDAGVYRFTVTTDDGARLWVNDRLVIDQWRDNQNATFQADVALAGGVVPLRLDYYENQGAALIKLTAERVGGGTTVLPPTPQPELPPGQTGVVANARWLNVRAEPSITGEVIAVLPGGQVVTLIGRNGGWIKVALPSGAEGWVGSSYLASSVDFATLPVVS